MGRWNTLLIYLLKRREVPTLACCSFMRGSTWRTAVSIAGSGCSMDVYQVSVPSHSWDQNPRDISFFCCPCHSAQPIPSRATDTSNSDRSPELQWAPPVFLLSQRQLATLILILTHIHSLSGGIRDGGPVTGPSK